MTDTVIDSLLVQVRADTQGFATDVQTLRNTLEGPLADGVESAARRMQSALRGFIQTGKLDFQDLKRVALSVIADIALAQVRNAIGQIGGGGSGGGGFLGGLLQSVLGTVLGAPGRAAGGSVTAGRAYRVGETGPELFVPQQAGRIVAGETAGRGPVAITINVAVPQNATPQLMQRSAGQVASAVRRALTERG